MAETQINLKTEIEMFTVSINMLLIEFLKHVYLEKKVPFGLVHPKGREEKAENPITKEYIKSLYDGQIMACMPYVVAGYLLGVEV